MITIIIAILAIAAPIVVVVALSRDQSLEIEMSRAEAYARDTLERSEITAETFQEVSDRLSRLIKGNPCSEENLDILEYAALAASRVQALGYISGNRLLCSTIDSVEAGYDLGPADYTASSDESVKIRANKTFPVIGDIKFFILEKDGLAGIIHEGIPLGTTTREQGVILATLNNTHKIPLINSGNINPAWLDSIPDPGKSVSFLSDDYIVALERSAQFDIVAVAAIPARYYEGNAQNFVRKLIPVGVIASIVLALAILFLSRQQVALPQAIKSAIKRDEFFIVYQPIVDLRLGKWVGAEALLRWRRTNGELVRPDIFIPIAEESGLMPQITSRVLQLVARDVGNLFSEQRDFHLAINLSPGDIHNEKIVEEFQNLQQLTGAGPGNLSVEITERGLTRPELARPVMQRLRDIGITTAVDDFGTGYSSLSYLESFDLDFLKIDKSFVDTIDKDGLMVTGKVVQHIIEIAKSLKLQMIAEGVESEKQKRFLTDNGVQFAQGWYFGKPMAFRELIDQLHVRSVSTRN